MENPHFDDVLFNAFVCIERRHYSELLLMISTNLKVYSKDGKGTNQSVGDMVT